MTFKDRHPSLPPGTTPGDIDDHFGEPDYDESVVEMTIAVGVKAAGYDRSSTVQDATDRVSDIIGGTELELVHAEVESVEPL